MTTFFLILTMITVACIIMYLISEHFTRYEENIKWCEWANSVLDAYTETTSVIKVQLGDGAKMPVKAHDGDASYDLCVDRDVLLVPGLQVLPTGVRLELPKGVHAFIMPTSGNSSKGMNARELVDDTIQNYRVRGHVKIGTIDSNYRGELGVTFDCYEPTGDKIFIEKGTKVAQLWITRETLNVLVEGDVNNNTNRGTKGFGSTDKQKE